MVASSKAYNKFNKSVEAHLEQRIRDAFTSLGWENRIDEVLEALHQTASEKGRKKSSNISGYNLFCREVFPDVKEQNMGEATKDLLKIIGPMWRGLDQDQKDEYNERAKTVKPLTAEQKKARSKSGKNQTEKAPPKKRGGKGKK